MPVTDEERAQHGMPRQEDLVTAAKAQANLAGQRGGVPQWAVPPGTVPQRRVVTITRPTVESEKAYALAGLGLEAGFVVGAVGLMTGRKYTAGGLKQIALNERLNALEARYGRGKQLQRNVIEARIHESLDAMEQRVRHAADDMKRRAHTVRRQAAKSANGEN